VRLSSGPQRGPVRPDDGTERLSEQQVSRESGDPTAVVTHSQTLATSDPPNRSRLLKPVCPSFLPLTPGVFTACVCPRVRPTVASAATATRVSTAIGGRSLPRAGGSAAATGSAARQREESPSATVSRGTPALPVTQVKEGGPMRRAGLSSVTH